MDYDISYSDAMQKIVDFLEPSSWEERSDSRRTSPMTIQEFIDFLRSIPEEQKRRALGWVSRLNKPSSKYEATLSHTRENHQEPDPLTKVYVWFQSKGLHRHISEWSFIKELLEAGLDPDKLK